ncbi:hypothetical protein Tco_1296165 [Tanacetum coccineum]
METHKPLLKDENGEDIDEHMYRSMIGSLMYLTSSRPDIMFAVCTCSRYQVNLKVSHLHDVKRIFRYLKGQPKLSLWYLKDSPFDLVAYTDSDYAGASLDRKSTTGGCQFLRDSNEKKLIQMIKIHTDKNVADLLTKAFDSRFLTKSAESEGFKKIVDFLNASSIKYALTVNPTIYTLCIEQFLSTAKAKMVNGEVQLQALVDGKNIIITEATVRRDLQLEDANGVDCLPNAIIFEKLTLMGMVKNVENVNKFLMYLRFVQVIVNQQVGVMLNHKKIYVTPSHTKKVFRNIKMEGKGFSGRVTPLFPTMMVQALKEMGEGSASPTNPHHTPIIKSKETFNEPNPQGTGSGSGPWRQDTMEDIIAQTRKLKAAQAHEITRLKLRVKKLEKKGGLRTHKLKRLYKIGRSARVISSDDDNLGVLDDEEVFAGQDVAEQEINVAEKEVSTVDPVTTTGEEVTTASVEVSIASPTATTTADDLTLAEALMEIRSARPKAKGISFREPNESTTITTSTPTPIPSKIQDKGKAKMIGPEKPLKKNDQIMFDDEVALKLQAELQAELEEEERLLRQRKEEANIAS